MGILGGLSGGLSAAGYAAGQVGMEGMKAALEEEKLKLISQLTSQREIAAEQRSIINSPLKIAADTPALVDRAKLENAVKLDYENQRPREVSPNQSIVVNGKTAYTAPPAALGPEMSEYYTQSAKRIKAEIQAIEEGRKYADKEGKLNLPKVEKVEDKATGATYLVDERSGAVGRIIPETLPKPGEWKLFGPNKAPVEAKPPSIAWEYNNKPLPNGLSDLYPDMAKIGNSAPKMTDAEMDKAGLIVERTVSPTGQETTSSRHGALNVNDPFKTAAPLKPAASPLITPKVASSVDTAEAIRLDQARAEVSAAAERLRSFGMSQQKSDPSGFAAAKAQLSFKQKQLVEAEKIYQQTLTASDRSAAAPRYSRP